MKLMTYAGDVKVDDLDKLKIEFTFGPGPQQETMEQKAARVKAQWAGRLQQ